MNRKPAVAGYFYPSDKKELNEYLNSVIRYKPIEKPKCIIVPHAGYVYSGYIAAKAYSMIGPYDIYVILGPNHTGLGEYVSVFDGIYETPLGKVEPCESIINEITRNPLAKKDYLAHLKEHSIEVQLPFIQFTNQSSFCIVPIIVGTFDLDYLNNLGNALAKALDDKNALIIVSSDFNHYEDQDTTLRKDNLAIEKILSLNPEELIGTINKNNISMCGANIAYVALIASLKLGAKKAKLIEHKTSFEVNGAREQTVGYASIIIQ
ncbi:MAG TPA: AmmeMemoRadiSam system protein B [Desulfurella acetivorans]|uniref:MEMO1 family protein ENM99_01500 n=1 Tax=Desulfurella acetivorans TaxID=33002 RepID=A0A7C6A6T0_DESAE|nr:AmmeMemoRadiSam system protein B [Desulfurella acetivorans]